MEEREGKPRENVFSVAVNPAKEAEKASEVQSEEGVVVDQTTATEAPEETKEDKE
jgi:hypothetical protein